MSIPRLFVLLPGGHFIRLFLANIIKRLHWIDLDSTFYIQGKTCVFTRLTRQQFLRLILFNVGAWQKYYTEIDNHSIDFE